MKKNKAFVKYLVIALAALVLIILAITIWLYTGSINRLKEKILTAVPAPIALIGGHPIYLNDFNARYNIASKFNTQSPSTDSQALKQTVLDGLIMVQKMETVAAKHGIKIDNKELNTEYNLVVQKNNAQAGQKFSDFLKTYGLTESDFKEKVLKPQLLTNKLTVWFNSQKDLNPDAYKTADDLQTKILGGADFSELAKTFSQDPTSQSLEGDIGFVQINDLLPELGESVDTMAIGQTKLVASRYGLHLIKLLEKNNNNAQNQPQIHLSQIYIKTSDFTQWLNNETKNLKIKILINPVN